MTISFDNYNIQDLNNEFISFKKEDVVKTAYYKYRNLPEFKSKKFKPDEAIDKNNSNRVNRFAPPSYKDKVIPEQKELIQYFIKSIDHSLLVGNVADLKKQIVTFKNAVMALKLPLHQVHYHYLLGRLFPLLNKYKSSDLLAEIVVFLTVLLLRGRKVIEIKLFWRPLYNIFKKHCYIDSSLVSFDENFDQDISNSSFLKHYLILGSYARSFFEGDPEIEEIHEEIQRYLIPQSNYIFFAINTIYIFLPTYHLSQKTDMPKWVDTYLNLYWNWIDSNKEWDERLLHILFRVVKHGHNIDWSPLIPSFFTRFIKVIDLSSPSLNRIKPVKHKIPDFYKIGPDENDLFAQMGKLIVALLNKPTERVTLDAIRNLFSQISLYYHPSNQGEWSNDLSDLVNSVSRTFLKKNVTIPYGESVVTEFLDMLFPLFTTSLYSKKKDTILYVCKTLKEFAYIAPNYVLPIVLDKYFSAIDKEEINRVVSGIEVLSTCIHPIMTLLPEGKSLLYNFMEINIKNLDPIYYNKASGSFKFFNRLFASISLTDETQYLNQCETQLEETTTLNTASFLEWSISFVDAVIGFMLKCSNKKDSSKREAPPSMFLHDTLLLFFSALSDEIYKVVLKRLVEFFTKSFEPEYYKLFSDFLRASTLRDPVQSISSFLPVFINKLFIKHKSSSTSNSAPTSPILTSTSPTTTAIPGSTSKYILKDLSDQEYKLYIGYIGYMIYCGGNGLVEFQDQLIDILTCLMSSDNKVVLKSSSKVIRKLIFALTRIYPSNYHFVSKDILSKDESLIKYWGTSDGSNFYPLDWFEPNNKTIEFTNVLVEKFLKCINIKFGDTIQQLKSKSKPFNRLELLNLLKPIQSIMRSLTYYLQDDSTIVPPKKDQFKFQVNKLQLNHGQFYLEKFSSLKREIFENIQQLIGFMGTEKNEEVQILRLISKTLFVMFFKNNDVTYFGSDSLLEKWRNHKKNLSRNYYIFRAYRIHLTRQKNHFDLCPLTEMVVECCKDLLNLSTHRYRRVRDISQKALVNIMLHYRDSHSHIVPLAIDRFSQLRSDEEVKGLCYILSTKTIVKKIKTNSAQFVQLVGIIVKTLGDEFKATTRNAISELKRDLLASNCKPTLSIHFPDELKSIKDGTYNCSWLPKEYIIESNEYNYRIRDQNRTNLLELLKNLLELLRQHKKKSSQPWKSHLFLLSILSYTFTILFFAPSEHENFDKDYIDQHKELIRQIFLYFAKETQSDYTFSRVYCIFILALILNRQGSKNIQFAYDGYFKLQHFGDLKYEKINDIPIDFSVLDKNLEFVNTIYSIVKDDINQVFDNASTIDNLVKKLLQDHEGEGLAIKFSISLASKKLSTIWPNIRLSGFSVNNFRTFNADFTYGLLSSIGIKVFDYLKPCLDDLKTKTHKDEISLLAELLAGLGRFISINDDLCEGRLKEIQEYCEKVYISGFINSSNEASDVWEMSIRYVANNVVYEKIAWVSDILFKNFRVPTANILGTTKAIRLIKLFLFEVPWKSKELIDRVVALVSEQFSNSYKQIRVDSFKLFGQILVFQTDYTVYPPIVSDELLKKIFTLVDYIEKSSPPSSTPPSSTTPNNSSPIINNFNNPNGFNNPSILSTIASPPNESILASTTNVNNNNYNQPILATTPATTLATTEKEKKACYKEGLTTFIFYVMTKSNLLIRSTPSLLKTVMELHGDSNPDVSKDATIIIYRMSQEFYCDTKIIDEIISTINTTLNNTSWKIRLSILPFIQIFFFNHSFYFTPNQVESIFNIVLTLTRDQHIEIREASKTTLASILISSKTNINRIKDLIRKSIIKLKTPNISTIEKHSSIIVLCAIVLANPYDFPTYLPEVLEQLSRFAYNSNFKGASTVLSDFWRTHSSTWEDDKLQFTERQIEDIQSTKVAPSYFA